MIPVKFSEAIRKKEPVIETALLLLFLAAVIFKQFQITPADILLIISLSALAGFYYLLTYSVGDYYQNFLYNFLLRLNCIASAIGFLSLLFMLLQWKGGGQMALIAMPFLLITGIGILYGKVTSKFAEEGKSSAKAIIRSLFLSGILTYLWLNAV
jgi:hypothetical protein